MSKSCKFLYAFQSGRASGDSIAESSSQLSDFLKYLQRRNSSIKKRLLFPNESTLNWFRVNHAYIQKKYKIILFHRHQLSQNKRNNLLYVLPTWWRQWGLSKFSSQPPAEKPDWGLGYIWGHADCWQAQLFQLGVLPLLGYIYIYIYRDSQGCIEDSWAFPCS